jgi:hypothetical protein
VISQPQRPLPDNIQHSQETNLHALGAIQTHNPNKRPATDRAVIRIGTQNNTGVILFQHTGSEHFKLI